MDKETPSIISDLGEFGLIAHLTKEFPIKSSRIIKGIGDDAAVISESDKCTIITTDLLIEGIHFDLIYTPLKHLGYKSIVVNVSDILSMNAEPISVTVSIAFSNKFSLKAIEELYGGIKLACDNYNIDLIGGDTSSSLTGLMISVTAIGQAKKEEIVYRDGAKTNDLICVSGDLGAAYIGLQLLEREKEVFLSDKRIQPDLSNSEYVLERQLKPEARQDIIKKLKEIKLQPTSMIDISDGLSSEIFHICEKSKTGCKIFEDKIPIHEQTIKFSEQFHIDSIIPALNGGEDYELLFTVPLSSTEIISNIPGISIIGYICDADSGKKLVTKSGSEIDLQAQGWNPIKNH
jgi:thiamine-monophosphate kinase